uniref:Uncharacterized protein n=1 Tax=Meloidogyne enterolobii TaxID=390850 RepID=A0A6V7UJF0_MELEN|nr:unnamed protein product [Meloidogyne enterolobii]
MDQTLKNLIFLFFTKFLADVRGKILRRQMLAGQKAAVEEQKPKSLTKILPKKEEKQKEEKKTLKRQSSNAAAELAKQHIPAKLAIAGVNTPRPSTSESEPIYLEKGIQKSFLEEKSFTDTMYTNKYWFLSPLQILNVVKMLI